MNIIKRVFNRITSPGKYITGPRRPFFSIANTVVNEETSMKVAAFHRGVIYISSQVAKLPWVVKDSKLNIIPGDVSNLLDLCPNPEVNAFRWRMSMCQEAIKKGNAYAEIERDGLGRAKALWQLYSDRMTLLRSSSGELYYYYDDPTNGPIYFSPRDIYHLPNLHLSENGLLGQGIIAYGSEVLGIQIAADTMAAGLFHNSGIPSGILTHPGRLSDEAYKRLKESWAEQQSGRKSGSTSILEEDIKYTAINIDSTALQFLESREFGILEIARFLGVPPTKLFDTKAATYSNVEQSNLEVATDTLDTWAKNFEMEADVKILNNRHGGRSSDIDLYDIFRGDMKSRSDYFKAMMSVAAITPNQIRAREGLPGYGKNGDNYYVATNNYTPVDRMNEIIDADIVKKTTTTTTTQKTTEENELEKAALEFLIKDK